MCAKSVSHGEFPTRDTLFSYQSFEMSQTRINTGVLAYRIGKTTPLNLLFSRVVFVCLFLSDWRRCKLE